MFLFSFEEFCREDLSFYIEKKGSYLKKGLILASLEFTTQIVIPSAPSGPNEAVRKTDMDTALASIGQVDPSSLGTAAFVDTGTAAGTVPLLVTGGYLPTSVIPALAISEVSTVASQTEMLALTAQPGDVAIRTDVSKTYILAASPASTLANWKEFLSPVAPVTSVNDKTGVIVLSAADVGLGNVTNTSDMDKPVSTAMQTALSGKEPTIAAGTSSQYWRGDKTWQTFPAIPTISDSTGTSTTAGISQKAATEAVADKLDVPFSGTITGTGSALTFTVTHNLGTTEPMVTMFLRNGTARTPVIPSYSITSANAISVSFGVAPTNGTVYTVKVYK
jgi:hypothetical protein